MINADSIRRWKQWLTKHKVTAMAACGFLGMGCILLSELPSDSDPPQREQSPAVQTEAHEDYAASLEHRLTEMLSRMEGVGEISVMVTVQSSKEQIYAEEVKESAGEHNTQREHKPIITQQNGEEAALITKTQYPEIQGVAILCRGGDNAVIREQICDAVSTILGIPVSHIYVGIHHS